MSNTKFRITYQIKLIFVAIVIIISSCTIQSNNDKTNKDFENNFLENIKQDEAKYFDFQYDGLTQQKSYFVSNKLKYLTFRHWPEVGFIDCNLTFDLTTDSIEEYRIRKVLPNFQKNEDENIVYDTLFLFYPRRHICETYFANKKINTTYRQDIFEEQLHFINNLKQTTKKNLTEGY